MEGPRPLKPEEFESLCALVNSVFRANSPGRMETQYPLLFAPENFDHLLVMVENGKVVAHVGTLTREISILGHPLKTISIGAVGTLPTHRGGGLATQLMTAAIRKGRDEGSQLMLISGGRGLYTRLGATRAGQYARFNAHRSVLPSGPVDIALATERDIPSLARLYAHEPVRYTRSVTDFRLNLGSNWNMDRGGELFTISSKGILLAYVATQRPNPTSPREANRVRLVELAGSRMAISQALPAVMGWYGVDTVELIGPATDGDIARILAAYGVFPTVEGFGGTNLILLPEQFLTAFAPYLESLLGPNRLAWHVAGEEITFTCGGQSLRVTASSLGQLWFGTVEPDPDSRLSLPDGPLREALDWVLPVQLPWYGLNYV